MADDADRTEWTESDRNYYSAAIQLIAQAEAGTWNRLAGFSVLTGFLFWVLDRETDHGQIASLAILGGVISFAFFALAVRSRNYVRRYIRYARDIEGRHGASGPATLVRVEGKVKTHELVALVPLVSAGVLARLAIDSGTTIFHVGSGYFIGVAAAGTVVIGTAIVMVRLVFRRPDLDFPGTSVHSQAHPLTPQQ